MSLSENITHTAVTDDCARLADSSPAICGAFKLCLREHLDIARLAGVTRSGDRFTTELLKKFRRQWPAQGPVAPLLSQKLAFVLGWLCHRAADRRMKPVFLAAEPDSDEFPTDCSVYHDVFLFREVYEDGKREPYSPASLEGGMESLPGSRALGVREVEEALRALWQRALIALHTFIPDQEDVEGWMERLFETRQRFYVDIRRYAEAFADPDPEKVQRFIVDANFYDRTDPLIRLARSLQHGRTDESIELAEALSAAASQSQYAQALRKGYLYLAAASEYFGGRLGEAELRARLDIGKPGG